MGEEEEEEEEECEEWDEKEEVAGKVALSVYPPGLFHPPRFRALDSALT